ncbi:MAG TPA: UDP-N-acetylmuramate dehydrogenase [Anaerohalosphaeraceae bacterium]|jgi:UDP-N-acetylmuramate dehydrogenase|nr:UDP-N-acetylmuramate dehydrogenase [Anaerohalosphaeraceae bacterium]HOT72709.1 UDP-N-acetylmuramate dehydrogenase [Anaerohalosphaeraceae bacterium]HPB92175.1 UDP-N-acetylmuramate dehydrogenase [Anaerohalosphaeraceae bacterium]HQG04867.1 UDP-N-acetylmuramate dehydrogenase [Anaerohalosphaeraceae bacterium]HQI07402.1 UDP-N-acetylmuramate dehydrogenase [Anaerohalosphaeraceae bacterium]
MSIFSGLENIVKEKCPLAPYTWYGLGGPADYLITPQSREQIAEVLQRCREHQLPVRVLGFGSNLLVGDEGVRGAVIRLENPVFCEFKFEGTTLKAGAGANLNKLVLESVRKGLAGLEALTGIPGSIGGAVRMNAGGRFGDLGSVVQRVTVMNLEGQVFEKAKPELVFDYRSTNITAKLILEATIELTESDPESLLQVVKEVWIYKKNTQPLDTHNAGCIFKNPRGMSAGALIDRAGLKGTQIGGAVVSEKHANFFIAEKGCRSSDVRQLIDLVRTKVREKFDVELELELEIW